MGPKVPSFVRRQKLALQRRPVNALLWPPQRTTSPHSTFLSANASPVAQEKEIVSPPAEGADAGVAGSVWRHSPVASAVVVKFAPRNVVVIVVLGRAKPYLRWLGCVCGG